MSTGVTRASGQAPRSGAERRRAAVRGAARALSTRGGRAEGIQRCGIIDVSDRPQVHSHAPAPTLPLLQLPISIYPTTALRLAWRNLAASRALYPAPTYDKHDEAARTAGSPHPCRTGRKMPTFNCPLFA
jgi:hypothetical protein